jgi:capsular polysaccharide export protein
VIVYLAEWNARKEAVFAALARADGGPGRRLRLPPLSFSDFPETPVRVEETWARAKRQPKLRLMRWLKRLLLRTTYNGARRHFAARPAAMAAAWNGLGGMRMAFLNGARDAGSAALHAELSPLPGRITLDPQGINAEAVIPRDPGFYRAWSGGDPARCGDGWREAGRGLAARPSRRTDVRQVSAAALPEGPFLFCPLQVPTDSQVQLFAGWCGSNDGFLAALGRAAQCLPEGWHLRLKEHPSARQSLAAAIAPLVAGGRIVLDNATDSFTQLAASRGVVTLNSSMGLQAFFFDKPVVTLGRAFFALPGLVTVSEGQADLDAAFADAASLRFDPALRAAFMNWLDQVYYPRFDWPGGEADLAAFADRIAQARAASAARPPRYDAVALSPDPVLR